MACFLFYIFLKDFVFFKIFQNSSFKEHLRVNTFTSYRNRSTDVKTKPMDWFLYDKDLRERVIHFLAITGSFNVETTHLYCCFKQVAA